MGNGDDHVLVGVEILGVEFIGRRYDLGPAGISVFFLEFLSLLLDKCILQRLVGQECREFLDQGHHRIIVCTQFLTVHTGELSQTHLHDGTCLYLSETKLRTQSIAGILTASGSPDQGYHLVDDVDGLEQTCQDVLALACLIEVELGAAHYHVVAVTDEILDELLEVEQAGTSVHQGNVVDGEAGLQGCKLEEGVEHHIGHSAHLELDDDAHTLAVALVIDICDTLYLLILH